MKFFETPFRHSKQVAHNGLKRDSSLKQLHTARDLAKWEQISKLYWGCSLIYIILQMI